MPVFANTFLFSFKQARICNDLGHSVSATSSKQAAHRTTPFNVRLTCRRSKNVLSDKGQFVINVHSVVPEVHRIRSIRSCEVMISHVLRQLTASSRVHIL